MPEWDQQSGGSQPSFPSIGQPFNPYKRFPGAFVPEPICRYKGLSPGAKLIYGRLCRYAGEDGAAYPALATLGAETGFSETQARAYVKELEETRFIGVDRENRHYRKNGSGGSNGFTFLWHAAFTGDSGELRKAPPLRKTEGVPVRKTAPLTPAENRTRRESASKRESVKESQSTSDSQPTNRKNRDSHAGGELWATDDDPEQRTPKQEPPVRESLRRYSEEEKESLSSALGSYGRRCAMRQHMGEEPPLVITQKCLEAAAGTSVQDIFALLRSKCLNGCEPGTSKGPRGWGWFPAVIASEVRAWREQAAAASDPARKTHWSEFPVARDPEMERAISAFDTLDDLGATA